ncbi:hypothetical protein OKW40_001398 [Paraburkholderia sp. RAU6.4a]
MLPGQYGAPSSGASLLSWTYTTCLSSNDHVPFGDGLLLSPCGSGM